MNGVDIDTREVFPQHVPTLTSLDFSISPTINYRHDLLSGFEVPSFQNDLIRELLGSDIVAVEIASSGGVNNLSCTRN